MTRAAAIRVTPPTGPEVTGWIYQQVDGEWAYGVSCDGEPQQGGFDPNRRKARAALRDLLIQFGVSPGDARRRMRRV